MEEFKKISISNIISQLKNMVISPKDALDSMGDDENFSNIASVNTFVFLMFIPLGLLFSQVIVGRGEFFKIPFSLWLLISGALLFYYLIVIFLTSKITWVLKDSMKFNGSQKKLNKIVVLTSSAFFSVMGLYWFLTFISKLSEWGKFLAPILGAGFAFYVLFMGFDSEKFETEESNKVIFVSIVVGTLFVLTLLLNLVLFSNSMF